MPESTAVAELTPSSTPASPSPSSAAPSPSSAATPSTQATTSTTIPSERPTDAQSLARFLEAAERAADATGSQSSTPATQAPAATAQPGTEITASDGASATQGPVPFPVHHKALENARTKAVEEYRQRFGWAERVTEPQFNQIRDLSVRLSSDPVGFYQWLGSQLQQHPQFSQRLAPPAAPKPRPEPDVEVLNAQGQRVGMTYSAERQAALNEWDWSQREAKLQQTLQPILQERDQRIAEAQQQQFSREVNAGADKVMTRIEKILDGKRDLFAHVHTLLAQRPDLDAEDAALLVREQHLIPNMKAEAERVALETQQKKAAGNTVNGAGSAPPMARPKNAADLAKWMAANEGAL